MMNVLTFIWELFSLNYKFQFSLLVPPSVPVIYNENNEPVEGRAGPYEESGQLMLTCVVVGGNFSL